jgi:hydroxyacylglutathione hydrolase
MICECLVVGPLSVNCYLYGNSATGDAVCIDPGSEPERIIRTAADIGLAIRAVLITHCHPDHILGAHAVADAVQSPILAPDGEQALWDQASAYCRAWGITVPQPPPPDTWIAAGEALHFGKLMLETRDVRGHSPAAIAYLGDGRVFVGDALFRDSVGRTDIPDADHATLIDRIRRNLLSLPPNTIVCTGHGPETTVGREARCNPFLM